MRSQPDVDGLERVEPRLEFFVEQFAEMSTERTLLVFAEFVECGEKIDGAFADEERDHGVVELLALLLSANTMQKLEVLFPRFVMMSQIQTTSLTAC